MEDSISTSDDVEAICRDLGLRINEELPRILRQLLAEQVDFNGGQLHLECSLSSGQSGPGDRPQTVKVASVAIATSDITPPSGFHTPRNGAADSPRGFPPETNVYGTLASPMRSVVPNLPAPPLSDDAGRPPKRRASRGLGGGRSGASSEQCANDGTANSLARPFEWDTRVSPPGKKRVPDNPNLQPSSLDKFISGIWESIFSGMKMDPAEVIEQWQAIESSGQPKLLLDTDSEMPAHTASAVQGVFGRMNILTRKISQTSRTCRSLEVIVEASWVQAFDDRVLELSLAMPKEKAKKTAISEACVDLNWSEKELRNKMAIWRGYHDISNTGGWVALVFAGLGLYRFCKYRVSFTEETFSKLRQLRHRFEVAADTLHPRWRSLLAIVGIPTENRYVGHPHDWVVCSPGDEACPLATTYHKWDMNFTYTHLDDSAIDEDAWGLYDPRTVALTDEPAAHACPTCGERQSDDPRLNACTCFPNLYGNAKAGFIPVQVFRTPTGKNNGLLACCAFEKGAAVGEFVGQITSGLSNMDVMVGQTDRATYQIWQGKQGNHTRFVNHSCEPNSQFERFVWLGVQRIVLVSKGIEADEEITVDYSDTYWRNLDKECLCGQPNCRYAQRRGQLLTPPDPS